MPEAVRKANGRPHGNAYSVGATLNTIWALATVIEREALTDEERQALIRAVLSAIISKK